jgi:hypothetical protein
LVLKNGEHDIPEFGSEAKVFVDLQSMDEIDRYRGSKGNEVLYNLMIETVGRDYISDDEKTAFKQILRRFVWKGNTSGEDFANEGFVFLNGEEIAKLEKWLMPLRPVTQSVVAVGAVLL